MLLNFPSKRGQGLGTKFQKMLYEKELEDGDFLLCEFEKASINDNRRHNAQQKFCCRLKVGWKDTVVNANTFGVEYRLWEYPLKNLLYP